jgi:hypothetical protein
LEVEKITEKQIQKEKTMKSSTNRLLHFKLFGEIYTVSKVKEVVELSGEIILKKYPYKVKDALKKLSNLSIDISSYDAKKTMDGKPLSYFASNIPIVINGETLYLGSSYSTSDAFRQITKMLNAVGANPDEFKVLSDQDFDATKKPITNVESKTLSKSILPTLNTESKNNQMPFSAPCTNLDNHKTGRGNIKERFYSLGGTTYSPYEIDFEHFLYDGKVYFISSSGYVCCSDEDGSNLKIIASTNGHLRIHVNSYGIYLYKKEDYVNDKDGGYSLWNSGCNILRYGFDGTVSIHNERFPHKNVKHYYICEDKVYFVLHKKSNEEIRCVDFCGKKSVVLYNKATSIERLFVKEQNIFFLATYNYAHGWIILNTQTMKTECLSNSKFSPEYIVTNPKLYDKRYEEKYKDDREDRDIVSINLDEEIFWVRVNAHNKVPISKEETLEIWEPRKIWGDRDKKADGYPIWKIKDKVFRQPHRGYFDGTYLFAAPHTGYFKSADRFGTTYEWSSLNPLHSMAEDFVILGNVLFMDVTSWREEMYTLSHEPVAPQRESRKSIFQEKLTQETINAFEAQKRNVYEC